MPRARKEPSGDHAAFVILASVSRGIAQQEAFGGDFRGMPCHGRGCPTRCSTVWVSVLDDIAWRTAASKLHITIIGKV